MDRTLGVLSRVVTTIRYRFLVFAGILPYILGSAVAFHVIGSLHLFYFLFGLFGISLVLVGVECFNEYFDSKIGTDRVFSLEDEQIPAYFLGIGMLAFGFAFLVGLYLTFERGSFVMVLAFIGFLAAAFYVAPPFKWAYQGLGEVVIALSYGPFMTLGAYYLQTQRIDLNPITASAIPSLLILALVLINEIPDYFQDRLVGKKNIVVRLGRRKAVRLYQWIVYSCFVILLLGLFFNRLPLLSSLIFLALPMAYKTGLIARENRDYPKRFIPAIRGTVFLYLTAMFLLILSYATSGIL